jgi:hypothetical protein
LEKPTGDDANSLCDCGVTDVCRSSNNLPFGAKEWPRQSLVGRVAHNEGAPPWWPTMRVPHLFAFFAKGGCLQTAHHVNLDQSRFTKAIRRVAHATASREDVGLINNAGGGWPTQRHLISCGTDRQRGCPVLALLGRGLWYTPSRALGTEALPAIRRSLLHHL